MLHNSRPPCHLDSKSFSLDSYIFSHVAAGLPRKKDFTLKMIRMHHIIPNQYIHPSGGFYSWLFAPDRGLRGNRTTKLCLGTYLTPLVIKKLYPLGGLYHSALIHNRAWFSNNSLGVLYSYIYVADQGRKVP